jgi:acetylornithine deacetylase/succinyl-diaminopimelate desuccinylase family protein
MSVGGSSHAVEAPVRVDNERLEALLREIVMIPSENPPGNERAVSDRLAEYLASHGLDVELQTVAEGRQNVVGRLRGDGPRKLVFNGHLDVVPAAGDWTSPPYSGRTSGRRLYGRGAADMKGGVAAMIEAAISLRESGRRLQGTLEVQGVVDEEVAQLGTRSLVQAGLVADYAVVCEPTGLRPCVASKGSYYYEVVTRGRSVHASRPELGVNAITHMARVIERIDALNATLRQRAHPLLGHPSIVVGTIEGGFVTCAVPDLCRVTLDRRVIPEEGTELPDEELEGVLNACRDEIPTFSGELRIIQKAPPMEIAVSERVVVAAREAVSAVSGVTPPIEGFSGVCDANWLVNAARIPTVVLGPGDLADAHGVDESIDLDEVALAARVYALMALKLLG